jgi:hypothetical protein
MVVCPKQTDDSKQKIKQASKRITETPNQKPEIKHKRTGQDWLPA